MIRRVLTVFVAALPVVFAACDGGGGEGDAGPEAGQGDAVSDAEEPDAVADAGADSEVPDVGEDTSADAADDAGEDTSGQDGYDDTSTPDTGGPDTASDSGNSGGDATGVQGPMSIRTLRSRVSLQPGNSTSNEYIVRDVIVTGIHKDGAGRGFFVQDASGQKANSGLWIFTGDKKSSVTLPTIYTGTVLKIQGTVENYDNMGNSTQGGLLELKTISSISVMRMNEPLPSPVQVAPSDVALSGPDSETYEGVLIEVQNVTVKNGPNNFDDTELQGGLFIGPDLYKYTNDFSPTSGTSYSSIVGPLNFSYDKMEIMPREMADITK